MVKTCGLRSMDQPHQNSCIMANENATSSSEHYTSPQGGFPTQQTSKRVSSHLLIQLSQRSRLHLIYFLSYLNTLHWTNYDVLYTKIFSSCNLQTSPFKRGKMRYRYTNPYLHGRILLNMFVHRNHTPPEIPHDRKWLCEVIGNFDRRSANFSLISWPL